MSFAVNRDPRCPEVHASTLLVVGDKLLSSWFGGTKEGTSDTKIWFAARQVGDDNSPWSDPRVIAQQPDVAHWNPILFQPKDSSTVMLFYKTGSPISSWKAMVMQSQDGGASWSDPKELVPGWRGKTRGPAKNKCITLLDGTIIAPGSSETADGVWECFTDSSPDGGKTWILSEPVKIDRTKITGEGAIQPSLLQPSPAKVTMLTRGSSGYVLRADSIDNGRTWGEMYATPLYNNNSGLDAVQLENGSWLVVHNPVNKNWGPRTPLVISKSTDGGKNWNQVTVLEDKPPPKNFTRIVAKDTGIVNDGESEFSYPAIVSDGEGGVYVSYTYERKGVKHVHVPAGRL